MQANTTTLMRHYERRRKYDKINWGRKEWMIGINNMYENWLIHQNSSFPVPAPVLVIDGNIEATPESLKKLITASIPQITLKESFDM